jgi:UDP-glucose 4-epimerase
LILQVASGRREAISVFGSDYETPDGTCVRDYVHVTDLAQAHIRALEYLERGEPSAAFNLGIGVGYSVRQVIESTRRVTGHPVPAVEAPRRGGDPPSLIASATLARDKLGWTPAYTNLDDIIASAWKFAKNHPNGYE